jgi:uncharacterized cupin superfamily protein
MKQRGHPEFIRNVSDFSLSPMQYPGDPEEMSIGAALSRPLGLSRIGVHYELLKPGRRTSWPRAEEKEEEFIFVLEGNPDVWVDGEIFPLRPGDCVAFRPGTGISHTFLNNSEQDAKLLVIGDKVDDNRVYYPLNPRGWQNMPSEGIWEDSPKHPLGKHPSTTDKLLK